MVQKLIIGLLLFSCKVKPMILPDQLFVIDPAEGALVSRDGAMSCQDPDAVYYVCMHVDDLIELKNKMEIECKK